MKRILSSIVVAILLTLPVSAFCVSLGNYVELNNATEISNVTELRNVQDLGGLESETIEFVERVLADGGTVEDVEFLNSFIVDAKANNYFSDIVAAYSPSWGVKGTTTASKLYSLIGAGQDLAQTTGASQPTISAADLNGKTRLTLDGIDDAFLPQAFTLTQPETVVLGGYRSVSHTNNDRIFDGFTSNSLLMRQGFVSGSVQILLAAGNINETTVVVGSDYHLRGLYNGAASAFQKDSTTEITGDIGLGDGGGISLGSSPVPSLFGNYKFGMLVILGSTIDANYDAKAAALKAFSALSYGTN